MCKKNETHPEESKCMCSPGFAGLQCERGKVFSLLLSWGMCGNYPGMCWLLHSLLSGLTMLFDLEGFWKHFHMPKLILFDLVCLDSSVTTMTINYGMARHTKWIHNHHIHRHSFLDCLYLNMDWLSVHSVGLVWEGNWLIANFWPVGSWQGTLSLHNGKHF